MVQHLCTALLQLVATNGSCLVSFVSVLSWWATSEAWAMWVGVAHYKSGTQLAMWQQLEVGVVWPHHLSLHNVWPLVLQFIVLYFPPRRPPASCDALV